MPSKCKCGGQLVLQPYEVVTCEDKRRHFEAKCDKCGVTRRQRKRQAKAS